MLLQWQEHCVECAPPLCYANCPLYVRRKDNKCARLVYGIFPNPHFQGLLACGADLKFRRWGKIEARLTGKYLPLSLIRILDKVDRSVTWLINKAEVILSGIDSRRRILNSAGWRKDHLLTRFGKQGVAYDEFIVECYGFEKEPCRLVVELRKNLDSIFRAVLEIQFGYNRFSLSIPLPPAFSSEDEYLLMLYPEGDKETRVVFTWLDFVVRKRDGVKDAATADEVKTDVVSPKPAMKVKCVAWDLDNTLWKGTLIEDGAQNLRVRPEAEALVRWFDERGIIQTIVSKNDHEEAMAVLARYGLEEFFLYPAINWGAKSANLRQIASRLNINIDTFALIDDSIFERQEVGAALPMVRAYPEDVLAELPNYPEFDLPVTDASRLRRKSYLTEMRRERAEEVSGSGHLEFLRSCHLRLRLFQPRTKMEIARCHELIQRSNQLNLSSRRYDDSQFNALLRDSSVLCVAMECDDRFGSYGIVGFASVEMKEENPVARDFVLSCRVAQKHVEHAFYGWLGSYVKQQGASTLLVRLIKTSRNSPLLRVFEEMPFTTVHSEGDNVLLAMDLSGGISRDDAVTVDDSAVDYRRTS
jgi:FkbH-like protein